MSKYEDEGQHREKVRLPTLKTTDWKTQYGQVKAANDAEDVSPRSKGEIPLTERHTEEIRRRIEEAKEKAAKTSPPLSGISVPSRSSNQPAVPPPINPDVPTSSLSSVSPELLTELRKIIRDEFEQLNKGEKQAETGDKPLRPPRPTSPLRPWADHQEHVLPAAATVTAAASLPGVSGEKRTNLTTRGPSPIATQHKGPPRHSTVRFSDETKAAVPMPSRSGEDENRKASSAKDARQLTAIDQKWGILFDKEGESTKRMEHVVKGLANYIIDEFMPQNSIVITPEKMAAFYSHHRLDKEVFPFAVLFKSRSKHLHGALESLYEDLGCQYFLAPVDGRSRPSVPSLTPAGFKQWLVSFIQAHPDEEAKRLDKVVSALPIEADSLLDGKRERLPKQISRYLLPEKPVRKVQKTVDEAMRNFTQDINNSSTAQSNADGSSSSCGRPTLIVMAQEKRQLTAASGAQSSRYIPDGAMKESRADDGGAGQERDRRTTSTAASSGRDHDDSRRKSMPPPPEPGHLGRTKSLDTGGRSSQNSRTAHNSSSGGGLGKSATGPPRKNRSPQRNPYSQSVPSGLSREDAGSDRRSSTISAAGAAGAALRPSSRAAMPAAQGMSSSTPALDTSSRDARAGGDSRDKRHSPDESVPRAPSSGSSLRDKAGLESSSSSKQYKRRSMVLPDLKGPTWDDYLKSSAPKSSTSSFMKRADPGYQSSG